jgi:hypothetical protein
MDRIAHAENTKTLQRASPTGLGINIASQTTATTTLHSN